MDIRQSSAYAEFMTRLGWKVERVGKWSAFIKNFPLLGSFIKIQRIKKPIPWDKIEELVGEHRAFRVLVEPDLEKKSEEKTRRRTYVPPIVYYSSSPYLPTRTIYIDLTKTEKEIFDSFSKENRWAVRKGIKNKLQVFQSDDIDNFLKLKTKQVFPLGFLLKREIRALWQVFSPNHASLLLVKQAEPVAGVLLLFYDKKAYYWLAASSKEGNNLSAPSLLVWKAIKLSKKRGFQVFDFEGIYDERFPKTTKTWQGFTKFKRGFGGKIVEYPLPLTVAKLGRGIYSRKNRSVCPALAQSRFLKSPWPF